MDIKAINIVIRNNLVDNFAGQLGCFLEQCVHFILCIFIKQCEDCVLKAHKADQALKPEAVMQCEEIAFAGIMHLCPTLGAAFPVPAVNIREFNLLSPFADIIQKRCSRPNHRATGCGNKLPLNAKHIRAALFFRLQRNISCHTAGNIIRNHTGNNKLLLNTVWDPDRFFPVRCQESLLF